MLSAVKTKKPGKDEGGPEKEHYNSKTRFSDGLTEKILFKQRLEENEGMSNVNIWRALQAGACSLYECPRGGACLGCHPKLAQTGKRRPAGSGPCGPLHRAWLFLRAPQEATQNFAQRSEVIFQPTTRLSERRR